MNPDSGPTPEQKAVELETAADIAEAHGNSALASSMRAYRARLLKAGDLIGARAVARCILLAKSV
jgi:hypothetical protein